jgi:hypothetical protein
MSIARSRIPIAMASLQALFALGEWDPLSMPESELSCCNRQAATDRDALDRVRIAYHRWLATRTIPCEGRAIILCNRTHNHHGSNFGTFVSRFRFFAPYLCLVLVLWTLSLLTRYRLFVYRVGRKLGPQEDAVRICEAIEDGRSIRTILTLRLFREYASKNWRKIKACFQHVRASATSFTEVWSSIPIDELNEEDRRSVQAMFFLERSETGLQQHFVRANKYGNKRRRQQSDFVSLQTAEAMESAFTDELDTVCVTDIF